MVFDIYVYSYVVMKTNMTIQLVNKVFRLKGYIGSNFNIADDKYMYYMPFDRCLVCYDAAADVDDWGIVRSVNCVRCEPCIPWCKSAL